MNTSFRFASVWFWLGAALASTIMAGEPIVTTQPMSQVSAMGVPAQFSVRATGE